ncbi:MAG: long-chain fatty acid--CoA ligase [Actinomycetota bacterium]|jgi:fatty-acyl-CoA synthase|nr:long-chain fatty acid--CoA ligase [Acidimicrobiales bacterium]MEC8828681.1 long-chain fatty acid--CoA ligase [Actinomycetota bacterium]MED6304838.1 long-chain fatty acid--CoA ligase [Actinomycetota bacterium]
MLRGLNMDRQLLVSSLIEYAGRNHSSTDVIATDSSGAVHRSNWSEIRLRAHRVSSALVQEGISEGDRVATIAWNDHRHLEVYYGVTGLGSVLHTINPRLREQQIVWIMKHANDQIVFVDPDFLPLAESIASDVPSVRKWVVLSDELTDSSLPNAVTYEDWIDGHSVATEWPILDEWCAATLCYTSGTTGDPKGVMQSHRSIVLQTWATCTGDGHDVNSSQSILLAVPMFHVNGWAIPFAAAMSGAKLVLPGPDLSAEALVRQIQDERITFSAGVPTIWLSIVQYLKDTGSDVPSLQRIAVGGSAAPRSLMDTLEDDYGVFVSHIWGMTEMTQGSAGRFTHRVTELDREQKRRRQAMAGRELYGVELRLVDGDGEDVARDGSSPGELLARGPWVAGAYFELDDDTTHMTDENGVWLRTGDVATMDAEGYISIVDRAKDVIKSGGEWISSIELENAAVGAPGLAEAAAVGMPHDRWGERPLLLVVLEPGAEFNRDEILETIKPHVASWWLPDAVVAVEEIPHTGTGKINKKLLREEFAGFEWPQ